MTKALASQIRIVCYIPDPKRSQFICFMSGVLASALWRSQRRNLLASSETGYGDTFVRDRVLLVRIQSASVPGGFRSSNQGRLVKMKNA
jgi:hypothetical protein